MRHKAWASLLALVDTHLMLCATGRKPALDALCDRGRKPALDALCDRTQACVESVGFVGTCALPGSTLQSRGSGKGSLAMGHTAPSLFCSVHPEPTFAVHAAQEHVGAAPALDERLCSKVKLHSCLAHRLQLHTCSQGAQGFFADRQQGRDLCRREASRLWVGDCAAARSCGSSSDNSSNIRAKNAWCRGASVFKECQTRVQRRHMVQGCLSIQGMPDAGTAGSQAGLASER